MEALRVFPQFECVARYNACLAKAARAGLARSFLPTKANHRGNFSDTSSVKSRQAKGSIGHAFTVCIRTENQNQMSFYPFVLHEISVLVELILGHLRSADPLTTDGVQAQHVQ